MSRPIGSYSCIKLQVNVFDKENGNGMHRFIRIECPGVVEEEITCFDDVPNGVKAGYASSMAEGCVVRCVDCYHTMPVQIYNSVNS